MFTYIITYDIVADQTSQAVYNQLHDVIRSYGTWARITESCWVVLTSRTAVEVRDSLLAVMRRNDRLMVIQAARNAAWNNVICDSNWLQRNV